MGSTTGTTGTAGGSRRSPRAARLIQAAVVLAVLLTAATRAFASPVGPIDASGGPARGPAIVAASLDYGIDARAQVDRVTVHRAADSADQTVTLVLADSGGHELAAVTTVLHGPDTVVALPAPVDPSLVGQASLQA